MRLKLLLVAWLFGAAPASAVPDFTAELVARTFFRSLLDGRPADALVLCAAEVNLDGTHPRGRAELRQALEVIAKRARQRGLQLRRMVVVDAAEAVRRFGPPPRRLRGSIGGGGRLVALARFDRLGAVAVLRREGGFWRVAALTD